MGTAYNTNVVTDGLISCWDAGNRKSYPGTGDTWYDVVNGNNGTLENMSAAYGFYSEKGGIIRFDGGDDYVACPQPNYDTTGDWSWCMWLNRRNTGGFSVWFGYGVNEGTRIFWYGYPSTVKIGIYSQESSGPQPTVTDRFPANEWCMFALKKEGNSLYFCFDADEWTEYTRHSGNWGSDEFIWRDIGKGHTTYYWSGYIASVHMYNRGISLDEVKQNYNATKSRFKPRITTDGLFASWDAGDPASYNGGQTWTDTANGFVGPFYNLSLIHI